MSACARAMVAATAAGLMLGGATACASGDAHSAGAPYCACGAQCPPLHAAQARQAVGQDHGAGRGAHERERAEAKVGLLEEVLEVHAVERGDEGAGGEAEGPDAEAQLEEHEGVAVGVEDRLDAASR
jgi:hypothetical protein